MFMYNKYIYFTSPTDFGELFNSGDGSIQLAVNYSSNEFENWKKKNVYI